MEIKVKVKDLLKKRRMTQIELSTKSGVPPATLSDIVNDKRTSINKEHLTAIAAALNVTDIKEIMDFEYTKKGD